MTEHFQQRLETIIREQELLIAKTNTPVADYNGIVRRYQHPVITRKHVPISWRYDLDPRTNPLFIERIGINTTLNAGAIKWKDRYLLMVRVEGVDRKSFFAIAESPNGIDQFCFWPRPVSLPDLSPAETNI